MTSQAINRATRSTLASPMQEFVLEMWEKEKVKACTRGTNIHKILEDYIEHLPYH